MPQFDTRLQRDWMAPRWRKGRGPKASQRAFESTTSDHEESDEKRGSLKSQNGISETDCVPTSDIQESGSAEGIGVLVAVSWKDEEQEAGMLHPTALHKGAVCRVWVAILALSWLFVPISLCKATCYGFSCSKWLKQVPSVAPMGQIWINSGHCQCSGF